MGVYQKHLDKKKIPNKIKESIYSPSYHRFYVTITFFLSYTTLKYLQFFLLEVNHRKINRARRSETFLVIQIVHKI